MNLPESTIESLLSQAQESYGDRVTLSSVETIPDDHPDRVIDKAWRDRLCPWKVNEPYDEPTITYTHTATVRYWHPKDRCHYLATYGVTDAGECHLWMD